MNPCRHGPNIPALALAMVEQLMAWVDGIAREWLLRCADLGVLGLSTGDAVTVRSHRGKVAIPVGRDDGTP